MAVIPGMGHKNKYHIVIKVMRSKKCGGQPELGQEEKAGDGLAGRHPDNYQGRPKRLKSGLCQGLGYLLTKTAAALMISLT